MDIEQLKLILETVKGITEDTSTVVIWYFILQYGLGFLSHTVAVSAILGAVYIVATAFKSSNDDTVFVLSLRDDLVENGSGWISDCDRKRIRQKIKELQVKNGNT